MFASTTASTQIACSQLARVSSQRKSSNAVAATSGASSSSSSACFSSTFETRRFTKLTAARNASEAKQTNGRGMAILAKATAEVRIERFFVLNSERRPSRGGGERRPVEGGFLRQKPPFFHSKSGPQGGRLHFYPNIFFLFFSRFRGCEKKHGFVTKKDRKERASFGSSLSLAVSSSRFLFCTRDVVVVVARMKFSQTLPCFPLSENNSLY